MDAFNQHETGQGMEVRGCHEQAFKQSDEYKLFDGCVDCKAMQQTSKVCQHLQDEDFFNTYLKLTEFVTI